MSPASIKLIVTEITFQGGYLTRHNISISLDNTAQRQDSKCSPWSWEKEQRLCTKTELHVLPRPAIHYCRNATNTCPPWISLVSLLSPGDRMPFLSFSSRSPVFLGFFFPCLLGLQFPFSYSISRNMSQHSLSLLTILAFGYLWIVDTCLDSVLISIICSFSFFSGLLIVFSYFPC